MPVKYFYTFLGKSTNSGQHHAYYIEYITRSLLSTPNMKISSIILIYFPCSVNKKSVLMNSEQKRLKRKQVNWKNKGIAHFPHKWRVKLWPILCKDHCFPTYNLHLWFLYEIVRDHKRGWLGVIGGYKG